LLRRKALENGAVLSGDPVSEKERTIRAGAKKKNGMGKQKKDSSGRV